MYDTLFHKEDLSKFQFLVTGGAGFIGSNLVQYLLKYNAGKVRVLDNFSTGYHHNLAPFANNPAFELIEGDIRDPDMCKRAVDGIDYVSHQAALGSVPRSINDPVTTNAVNISGFLNMLCAVKDSGSVKRFIYASSSSVYGSNPDLPKIENHIGAPLSPYAVTKQVAELYGDVFSRVYGMKTIGLRYFNVFGPGQSPNGQYAAVIPLFLKAINEDKPAVIFGDGEQTRDFTFVENAVQANIRAFFADSAEAVNQVYNIAGGERISLNELWQIMNQISGKAIASEYKSSRAGDIKNSLADISKAIKLLGYDSIIGFKEGLRITVEQFRDNFVNG
jgi:UDP-N-acetylglucosamine 4-epimerase